MCIPIRPGVSSVSRTNHQKALTAAQASPSMRLIGGEHGATPEQLWQRIVRENLARLTRTSNACSFPPSWITRIYVCKFLSGSSKTFGKGLVTRDRRLLTQEGPWIRFVCWWVPHAVAIALASVSFDPSLLPMGCAYPGFSSQIICPHSHRKSRTVKFRRTSKNVPVKRK
jgi:hypothetical protein